MDVSPAKKKHLVLNYANMGSFNRAILNWQSFDSLIVF